MKIVINKCYGGFSVTKAVYEELHLEWNGHGSLSNEKFGIVSDNSDAYRASPELVAAVEKIGVDGSSGRFAKLKIVEIPEGVTWEIDEYDGIESIRPVTESWD